MIRRMRPHASGAAGFTLIEVLVALMVIAMALAALMIAVSGTARTSGYLRDKTIAQWIALNRLSEVRLNLNKFGANTDTAELSFANRKWHYDTRYFDTSIATMKRIVVRVYAGDAKSKGSPLAESTGFLGSALASPPGVASNQNWVPIPTQPTATPNGTTTTTPTAPVLPTTGTGATPPTPTP